MLIKKFVLSIALLIAMVSPAFAERTIISSSGASFEPPTGFTELTQQEIDLKYPSKNPPKFVVGNERRTTTIAYAIIDEALMDQALPKTLTSLEQQMQSALPGLKWFNRKLIKMQGQRWIYLEMTSKAVDTSIHNIMLMTPHDGKMLIINFNSTIEEFPQLEKALRKSLKSITLQ